MEKEILADEPIEEFSDDLLSRKSFVENLLLKIFLLLSKIGIKKNL